MSGFIRRAAGERGLLRNDWLEARFSFSFGPFVDPRWPRFGALLALNEDRVQPQRGFDWHAHEDLEIVAIPLQGEIEHQDSEGGAQLVSTGQWQWMRAGHGIAHRQWNPSPAQVDHHLQIWIAPGQRQLPPQVQRLPLPDEPAGRWAALLSPRPEDAAQDIGVDLRLLLGRSSVDAPLHWQLPPGRSLYLHTIGGWGEAEIKGHGRAPLTPGDALVLFDGPATLRLSSPSTLRLLAVEQASQARQP